MCGEGYTYTLFDKWYSFKLPSYIDLCKAFAKFQQIFLKEKPMFSVQLKLQVIPYNE